MAEADHQEDEEIIPVMDEEKEELLPGQMADDGNPPADDLDVDDNEDDEDDGEADARMGAGESDDDEKTRRREERKNRRQRQKEARDRDQREMSYLRKDNERLSKEVLAIAGRVANTEVSGIDQRINQIKGQIKLADQVIAKAVTAGQGEDLVEAQGIWTG